jgi:hypothetical protein
MPGEAAVVENVGFEDAVREPVVANELPGARRRAQPGPLARRRQCLSRRTHAPALNWRLPNGGANGLASHAMSRGRPSLSERKRGTTFFPPDRHNLSK